MTEPAPDAPPEVKKDGQVLRHTTATEARKHKRRIVRPEERLREIVERYGEPFDDATHAASMRTLDDLMSFDLGDRYYVHVVRKEPKTYGGTRCDGAQKPIRRKMTGEEFARLYGGLKYELTVYGPRGVRGAATGVEVFRALTRPISVTLPGVPPNLQMTIGYDADDLDDDPGTPHRRLPVNADARIYDARDFASNRNWSKNEVQRECQHVWVESSLVDGTRICRKCNVYEDEIPNRDHCRHCARHRKVAVAAMRRERALLDQLTESKALTAALLRAVADALAPREGSGSND
jgi:hypothetical protein